MTYFWMSEEEFRKSNRPSITAFPESFMNRTPESFLLDGYSAKNREAASFAKRAAMKYIQKWESLDGMGLYFVSKTRGTGKTMLSTIIGAELTKQGYWVEWCNMTTMLGDLRTSYDKESGRSTADIIRKATNSRILILDDIGVEKQSAWVNETIYNILDQRAITKRPTIYTSNLRIDELAYDERILSRIRNRTYEIRLPEESMRDLFSRSRDMSALMND